jgi:type VI secretion system protein ImpA
MSSVAELDLTGLMAPIPGDNPAGVDLREDDAHGNDFRAVKDLRDDARRLERKVDSGSAEGDDTANLSGMWPKVVSKGEAILTERSKDLEIVAYLTEAYARLEGFAGVARGFRLARELAENYWDTLYPQPDEYGMATRVLPITWLNGSDGEGSLIEPLTKIPLTGGKSKGPYALRHYKQAVELANVTDPASREDRIRHGATTREQIDAACKETDNPYGFFPKLIADINDCQAEFKALDKLLTEKCGSANAPPTSKITNTLQECLDAVKKDIGKQWSEGPPGAGGGNGTIKPDEVIKASGGGGGSFQLSTRDDAFRILMSVADFFERTEPQSLLPAQLRRVVEWGKLSPQELFARVIEDESALQQMYKLVGIPRPDQES